MKARAVNNSACGRKLVMGDTRNLKVTYPQDLALAGDTRSMQPPINADKCR